MCQGVANTSLGGAVDSCREGVVYPPSGEGEDRGQVLDEEETKEEYQVHD